MELKEVEKIPYCKVSKEVPKEVTNNTNLLGNTDSEYTNSCDYSTVSFPEPEEMVMSHPV